MQPWNINNNTLVVFKSYGFKSYGLSPLSTALIITSSLVCSRRLCIALQKHLNALICGDQRQFMRTVHTETHTHTYSHTSLAAFVGARNIYLLPRLAGLQQIDDIVNVDSCFLPMRMLAVVAALIAHGHVPAVCIGEG